MTSGGTMTAAQICAMWRNDARALRREARSQPDTLNADTKMAAAFQLEQCAEELALHLHTAR